MIAAASPPSSCSAPGVLVAACDEYGSIGWPPRPMADHERAPESARQYSTSSGEARGERDEDRTQPLAGPEQLDGLAAVPCDCGYAVARADAASARPPCEARCPFPERAIGETHVAVHDRLRVRGPVGGVER